MSTTTQIAPRGFIQPRAGFVYRRAINAVMLTLAGVATLIALIPLVWIVVYVAITGGKYLNLDLFTKMPTGLGQPGGGVLPALEGTILTTILSTLFSVPVAILAAFYAANRPNTPLGVAVRFGTDVLAGVPSIVIGLFGYAVIVQPQGHYSGLAAGVAVAIVMLPTIIRTTEEMLKLVPKTLREGSLALGAPEWITSLRVVLPAAASGVVTGIMLAIARGVGETAPLLFTALGNDRYEIGQIVTSGVQGHLPILTILNRIIDQPIDGLTLTMWKYAQQPFPERIQQSWAVALVLMLFVLVTNILVRWLISRNRVVGR
jgi:phosphate transport system permease protein